MIAMPVCLSLSLSLSLSYTNTHTLSLTFYSSLVLDKIYWPLLTPPSFLSFHPKKNKKCYQMSSIKVWYLYKMVTSNRHFWQNFYSCSGAQRVRVTIYCKYSIPHSLTEVIVLFFTEQKRVYCFFLFLWSTYSLLFKFCRKFRNSNSCYFYLILKSSDISLTCKCHMNIHLFMVEFDYIKQ